MRSRAGAVAIALSTSRDGLQPRSPPNGFEHRSSGPRRRDRRSAAGDRRRDRAHADHPPWSSAVHWCRHRPQPAFNGRSLRSRPEVGRSLRRKSQITLRAMPRLRLSMRNRVDCSVAPRGPDVQAGCRPRFHHAGRDQVEDHAGVVCGRSASTIGDDQRRGRQPAYCPGPPPAGRR